MFLLCSWNRVSENTVGTVTIQSKCYFIKARGFGRGMFISRIFLLGTPGSAAESSALHVDLRCRELVLKFFEG